jgi:hypothetical protein
MYDYEITKHEYNNKTEMIIVDFIYDNHKFSLYIKRSSNLKSCLNYLNPPYVGKIDAEAEIGYYKWDENKEQLKEDYLINYVIIEFNTWRDFFLGDD